MVFGDRAPKFTVRICFVLAIIVIVASCVGVVAGEDSVDEWIKKGHEFMMNGYSNPLMVTYI